MKQMKTVRVHCSRSYNIHIQQVLLKDIARILNWSGKKIGLITDQNVDPFYGPTLVQSLQERENAVYKFVLIPGEEQKNWDTAGQILDFLAAQGFHRDDALISLGGGVVGDLTGFVASIYARGIDYCQIPTTLLAAVDASVGGKTGLNLTAGKNLCGSIYQPRAVFCDTDVFKTLDDAVFSDGIAEAIKYALLFDEELFWRFSEGQVQKDSYDLDEIIKLCVQYKADIVREDEFDLGLRQKLNFGHTIGHAIEKRSAYRIRHGQAVAIGMMVILRALEKTGRLEIGTASSVEHALVKYNLPVFIEYDVDEILQLIRNDKKILDGKIAITALSQIGSSSLMSLSLEEFDALVREGWSL